MAMTLAAALAGLLWAKTAAAGVPVSLPDTEDPAQWRVPFALAGLEVASDEAARVHIDQTASGWVLRARGSDGVVRTARVIVPDTPAEREEVAFLARGLLTAIQAQEAELPSAGQGKQPVTVKVPPPPPPPPPPPIAATATAPEESPKRVPAQPVPEPVPEPAPEIAVSVVLVQVEPAPAPQPPLVPDDGLALSFDPLEDAYGRRLLRKSRPEPAPEAQLPPLEQQRIRRPREPLRAPPFYTAQGFTIRPLTEAAYAATLGMQFAGFGQARLGWRLTFLPPRRLIRHEEFRTFQALDWEFDLFLPPIGPATLIFDGGVSARWYFQQFAFIDSHFMPVWGFRVDVPLLPARRSWALGLDLGSQVDLGETVLTNVDNSREDFVPIEFRANFYFRWKGKGDPFTPEVTSNR